ncbi:FAD-dependent oxidoreductase [Pigmentiphaga soli]|uniref:FAD-dependent oxidoreductase n=1 Tax=Pigmentiphaga soli TaxID=1007095 RepID=A0ABP8GTZ0_9BURK
MLGGGIVGCSIAFGLARAGLAVTVLDEGDVAFRTSRGSFGLIWTQSKGVGCPDYHFLSRRSADAWQELADELSMRSGVDTGFRRPGGVSLYTDEPELERRIALCGQLAAEAGDLGFDYQVLRRPELDALVPGLGPRVIAGVYTRYDGDANPLALMRALNGSMQAMGVRYVPQAKAVFKSAAPNAFAVSAGGDEYRAPKVVLAAGVANKALATQVGMNVPVRPQRGQIIITERARQFLSLPTWIIRQMSEGGFLIGDSKEEVGFDERTSAAVLQDIARRAVLSFPFLASLRIVRTWGALRVMSPDGLPIYDQSERCPGAFVVTCHSGVTLTATHAYHVAPAIARGALVGLDSFSTRRFDVQTVA